MYSKKASTRPTLQFPGAYGPIGFFPTHNRSIRSVDNTVTHQLFELSKSRSALSLSKGTEHVLTEKLVSEHIADVLKPIEEAIFESHSPFQTLRPNPLKPNLYQPTILFSYGQPVTGEPNKFPIRRGRWNFVSKPCYS